jgi:hypothetical protein
MLISVFIQKWTIWTYACLALRYRFDHSYTLLNRRNLPKVTKHFNIQLTLTGPKTNQ